MPDTQARTSKEADFSSQVTNLKEVIDLLETDQDFFTGGVAQRSMIQRINRINCCGGRFQTIQRYRNLLLQNSATNRRDPPSILA